MNNALRLLLTLFTILCCSTISGASIQESQAGVVFEKACVLEGDIGFWADFNAPKSGTGKPWTTGAKPNSKYNHLDKNGKVKQTAVYDKDGNVIGHVDYKNHGKGAPSGHGHKFPEPGNPASGHGKGKPHIPRDQLPRDWTELPKGVEPLTPIGQ